MAEVKETKEVVVALIKVVPVLVNALKDGAQAEDFTKVYAQLWANPEMRLALEEAWKDIKLVNDEIKDIQFKEVVEILSAAIPELLKSIKAIKEQ